MWIILVVLLMLWLIGFFGGFVTTNLIHVLLVGALIILAFNLSLVGAQHKQRASSGKKQSGKKC